MWNFKVANNTQNKRAFNIKETAKYACVSEGIVRNWITSGLIPYEELPGKGNGSRKFRLIRKRDLDNFLNIHYNEPEKKKPGKIDNELVLLPKGSSHI